MRGQFAFSVFSPQSKGKRPCFLNLHTPLAAFLCLFHTEARRHGGTERRGFGSDPAFFLTTFNYTRKSLASQTRLDPAHPLCEG